MRLFDTLVKVNTKIHPQKVIFSVKVDEIDFQCEVVSQRQE